MSLVLFLLLIFLCCNINQSFIVQKGTSVNFPTPNGNLIKVENECI